MTKEKFEIEINTLKKFFEFYCEHKHNELNKKEILLTYKEKVFDLNLNLCKDCHDAINYSFQRLQECPHEDKPRCRNCPTPCYEKDRWKNAAQVMKFSAVRLGLSKMKQKVKSLFT